VAVRNRSDLRWAPRVSPHRRLGTHTGTFTRPDRQRLVLGHSVESPPWARHRHRAGMRMSFPPGPLRRSEIDQSKYQHCSDRRCRPQYPPREFFRFSVGGSRVPDNAVLIRLAGSSARYHACQCAQSYRAPTGNTPSAARDAEVAHLWSPDPKL